MRSALVLQHDPAADAGLVGAWLAERRIDRADVVVPDAAQLPDPAAHDLVVVLGSEHCAADDTLPWLGGETALLRRAQRTGVPVLAICFGAQLLARALGGGVRRAAVSEIGWRRLATDDEALVEPGPWFEWHFDTVEAPPGGRAIARSPAGVEAFVIGRSLAVQFHPEVDDTILERWCAVYGHELRPAGVRREELLLDDPQRRAEAAARARRLFDAFARHAGLAGHREAAAHA